MHDLCFLVHGEQLVCDKTCIQKFWISIICSNLKSYICLKIRTCIGNMRWVKAELSSYAFPIKTTPHYVQTLIDTLSHEAGKAIQILYISFGIHYQIRIHVLWWFSTLFSKVYYLSSKCNRKLLLHNFDYYVSFYLNCEWSMLLGTHTHSRVMKYSIWISLL